MSKPLQIDDAVTIVPFGRDCCRLNGRTALDHSHSLRRLHHAARKHALGHSLDFPALPNIQHVIDIQKLRQPTYIRLATHPIDTRMLDPCIRLDRSLLHGNARVCSKFVQSRSPIQTLYNQTKRPKCPRCTCPMPSRHVFKLSNLVTAQPNSKKNA